MEINKCTFCGKPLDDILVKTTLDIAPYRKREDGTIEKVENNEACYIECLCIDCFDKLSHGLNAIMNEAHPENKENDLENKEE